MPFRTSLLSRLESADRHADGKASVPVLSEEQIGQLERYFELLQRWNRRINLTALPLDTIDDQTIDRLFVEPLIAARFVGPQELRWADLGSGGGSPAVPLKIARPLAQLIMVEPRSRKAAFLREVSRELAWNDVGVAEMRAEAAISTSAGVFDVITVRGVRLDGPFLRTIGSLLSRDGRLLVFVPGNLGASLPGFCHLDDVAVPATNSRISLFSRLPA